MSDQVLAARFFDAVQMPGLVAAGLVEDGVQHLRRTYVRDAVTNPVALRQLRVWAAGEFAGKPCIGCDEAIGDDDQVSPTVAMGDDGPQRRWWHNECMMLGIVGHQYGVCGCHGFDKSRASALELRSRLQATAAAGQYPAG